MVFINIKKCDAIILAGGFSQRMNLPKVYIEFDKGITFLEKIIIEYYMFGCERIILILNHSFYSPEYIKYLKEKFNTRFILNYYPDRGRFYSIKLGTELTCNENYCFIQNIDNPFTDAALLNKMYDSRNMDSYIVPVFEEKGGHPVLLSSKITERILNEKRYSDLRNILNDYNRINVQSDDPRITANINTVSDYYTYFGKEPSSILSTGEKHLS